MNRLESQKLAYKIILEMKSAGLTPEEMLKVIELVKEKLK